MSNTVKIVKIGNSAGCTIPSFIRRQLGVKAGDVLEVELVPGGFICRRA